LLFECKSKEEIEDEDEYESGYEDFEVDIDRS
jgi:hypothetical protein